MLVAEFVTRWLLVTGLPAAPGSQPGSGGVMPIQEQEAKAGTGLIELKIQSEQWPERAEGFSYLLFVEGESSARSVRFEQGRCTVRGVPLGRRVSLYWGSPWGPVQGRGVGPVEAGSTVELSVHHEPWPPGLVQEREGLIRPIRAEVVDEQGRPLHAGRPEVWTFYEEAPWGVYRWNHQDDQVDVALRGEDGARGDDEEGEAVARPLLFELSVNRVRPSPGELVVALRTPRHGMEWVARRPLTVEQDYAGGDLGPLVFRRADLMVAGQVLEDGRPVPGAAVWVEPLGDCPEEWDLYFLMPTMAICGITDEAGRFRLYGFTEASRFRVFAVPDAGPDEKMLESRFEAYDQTFIPTPCAIGQQGVEVQLTRDRS